MTAALETIHVLIVDDNRQMRHLIRSMLWGLGLRRIYQAGDAIEALEIMHSADVDVVLLDWMMQPLSGLECARLLRAASDSPRPLCGIVMVSGYADKGRVRQARDAGVNSFLAKPLSARALQEHVTAAAADTRPFIRSLGYIGPDRRRGHDLGYHGPLRRSEDVQDAHFGDLPPQVLQPRPRKLARKP